MLIHVVRPGETVYAIARNYGVDPRRLMADNGVPADGALAVGQTLVLRFPNVVHAVQPGETLTSIARSYGVSVRSLWRNNPELLGGSLLAPGQVLVITYHEEKLGTVLDHAVYQKSVGGRYAESDLKLYLYPKVTSAKDF